MSKHPAQLRPSARGQYQMHRVSHSVRPRTSPQKDAPAPGRAACSADRTSLNLNPKLPLAGLVMLPTPAGAAPGRRGCSAGRAWRWPSQPPSCGGSAQSPAPVVSGSRTSHTNVAHSRMAITAARMWCVGFAGGLSRSVLPSYPVLIFVAVPYSSKKQCPPAAAVHTSRISKRSSSDAGW